jgi:hypothetical protein
MPYMSVAITQMFLLQLQCHRCLRSLPCFLYATRSSSSHAVQSRSLFDMSFSLFQSCCTYNLQGRRQSQQYFSNVFVLLLHTHYMFRPLRAIFSWNKYTGYFLEAIYTTTDPLFLFGLSIMCKVKVSKAIPVTGRGGL